MHIIFASPISWSKNNNKDRKKGNWLSTEIYNYEEDATKCEIYLHSMSMFSIGPGITGHWPSS